MGFAMIGDLLFRDKDTSRELCGVCAVLALDFTTEEVIEWVIYK